MRTRILRTLLVVLCLTLAAAAQFSAIGREPGKAVVSQKDGQLSLSNAVVRADWQMSEGKLRLASFTDRLTGSRTALNAEPFVITLKDGTVVRLIAQLGLASGHKEALVRTPSASRLSETLSGQAFVLELYDAKAGLFATWRGILRDGSNYIRQELTLKAAKQDVEIAEVRMLDLTAPDAKVVGTVRGSPVVAGDMFFGFEHPLSTCKAESDRVQCSLARQLPLRAGQSVTYSSVIGVAPVGQMRRSFLNYVERERAHPYRPFLHYNSWYDLGYFSKYDEAGALNVIETYGTELTTKRGVKLDSFLFDDGWDDPTTLWSFHSGFPSGFAPLTKAAAKFNAAPGVWMSPWGGYGKPREERLKFGKEAGFETTERSGFALSGPKYYERFRETMLNMVRKYGVTQFKIDGTGNANRVFPGSRFDSDFDAAISLISELRTEKPDIYINLTTGTYPSPFWLRYADSIWRGGSDHDFAGVGSDRQQWITYRDADTYKHVVQRGPLYPLNALMLHGLIYARHAKKLDTDPAGDFADEIHDYFGTGTQLQEMYVTPALLTQENWDTLAEAAKWSRAHAAVLVDTHWIGGDPGKLEVYGWASWSPKKAILVLRNPSDKPQSFAVDVARAFELPASAAKNYAAHSPWAKDSKQPSIALGAGQEHTVELKPFEVLVLDAVPKR
jgi:hypothetical protein